jgi:hypothetical protein
MNRTLLLLAILVASCQFNIAQEQTGSCVDKQLIDRVNAPRSMPRGPYFCEFGGTDLLCGGCSGGKLIAELEFCYPHAWRSAHLSGFVQMKMVVDRHGKVLWAEAHNDAPLLLRAAATKMALGRRYEPFVCYGRRVKAVVHVTYKFVA